MRLHKDIMKGSPRLMQATWVATPIHPGVLLPDSASVRFPEPSSIVLIWSCIVLLSLFNKASLEAWLLKTAFLGRFHNFLPLFSSCDHFESQFLFSPLGAEGLPDIRIWKTTIGPLHEEKATLTWELKTKLPRQLERGITLFKALNISPPPNPPQPQPHLLFRIIQTSGPENMYMYT